MYLWKLLFTSEYISETPSNVFSIEELCSMGDQALPITQLSKKMKNIQTRLRFLRRQLKCVESAALRQLIEDLHQEKLTIKGNLHSLLLVQR